MSNIAPFHVLIIPAWFQPEMDGHLGVYIREQALELARIGIRTGILFIDPSIKKELKINKDNYTEWLIPLDQPRNRVHKILLLQKTYHTYYRSYTQQNGTPNILHSHGLFALIPSNYLSKRADITLFHTEHLGALMNKNNYLLRIIAFWLYKHPKKIISVSEAHLSAIKSLTGNKGICIPNLVHRTYFEIIPKNVNTDATLQFLTVSDLELSKGHQLLLDALQIVRDAGIDFHWHVIGEGPEKEKLLNQINNVGLKDKITFIGKKSRKEIRSILPYIDLYISASKIESFGLHIAESIAAGVFTVTYHNTGASMFQTETNSFRFDTYTASAAAQAIITGIKNSKSISSEFIRLSVINILHPDIVINQLQRLYRN